MIHDLTQLAFLATKDSCRQVAIVGGVAQLVRALACHARGRGFKSRHPRSSPGDFPQKCGEIARVFCCADFPARGRYNPCDRYELNSLPRRVRFC